MKVARTVREGIIDLNLLWDWLSTLMTLEVLGWSL